jgi:2,4-dienoyl-CoA reductase (NADPH2)
MNNVPKLRAVPRSDIDRNVDPVSMPERWRILLARQIKEVIDAPFIGVGVIRRSGRKVNFVALGRALLADPEWPNVYNDRTCRRT